LYSVADVSIWSFIRQVKHNKRLPWSLQQGQQPPLANPVEACLEIVQRKIFELICD
ncbi:unnamed protein product, partial [Prunus brigantina]